MIINLNGKNTDILEKTVFQLRDRLDPSGYAVVDGFGISSDMDLVEGMTVCIFSKTEPPSEEEFEAVMSARDGPGIHSKMKGARVGVAGLGGLGSNAAVLLARAGIGYLLLVDMDTVDATNINRQDYEITDIGRSKCDALRDRISRINPFTKTDTVCARVTSDNASSIFKDCNIVIEAFDRADDKAMLISTILSENPGKWVVSGNGVAGIGPAGDIRTSVPMNHLVMCGDMDTDARPGIGLVAPHVVVAAAHQANAVMRLVIGEDPLR